MTQSLDLTRWNRAGLSRFRYVDGNAVVYLELLRAALAKSFPNWKELADPDTHAPANLSPDTQAHVDYLLRQYAGTLDRKGGEPQRGSVIWEVMRSFARASHILTEYIDAYANESFLGTTTQWDNARRLVAMLDHHPAPPASASTPLVVLAKPGQQGKLLRGFQVKHAPAGGKPVIFETLSDLDLDDDLNALRLAGFGCSPASLLDADGYLLLPRPKADLKVGDPVVLENTAGQSVQRCAARITELQVDGGQARLKLKSPVSLADLRRGSTTVHLDPADRLEVLGPAADFVASERAIHMKEAVDVLGPGDVVHVGDGRKEYFRVVTRARGRLLTLASATGDLQLADAWVTRARKLSVTRVTVRHTSAHDGKQWDLVSLRIPGDYSALAGSIAAHANNAGSGGQLDGQLSEHLIITAKYYPIDPSEKSPPAGRGFTTLTLEAERDHLKNPQFLWLRPISRDWQVDAFLAKPDGSIASQITTRPPKKASPPDLAVLARGDCLAWGRLGSVGINPTRGEATLGLLDWRGDVSVRFYLQESTLFAHFREQLKPLGWDDNTTPVIGNELTLDKLPDRLVAGRQVLIEQQGVDGDRHSRLTTLQRVGNGRLVIEPDKALLPDERFSVANTVIRGNVVPAGHGERKPEKVMGSGNAAESGQSFVLAVGGVSFIADPGQASGVAADLELRVDGKLWQQVSSLNESGSADAHYGVRMIEDGTLRILFGDGARGRRLPTGENNVRVAYREGAGAAGNLPAGSLVQIGHPHPLVDSVRQPLDSVGGAAMESVDSLRKSAPRSVLALERAVSLADFASLAGRHSKVWQARALAMPGSAGCNERVEVVVVPAEGTVLGGLGEELTNYLTTHAPAGVSVMVNRFLSQTPGVDIAIRVISAEYDPAQVVAAVRSAVLEAFSLRRRGIGEVLYLSDLYRMVEQVVGVENSVCVLDGRAELRLLAPSLRTVIYLDGGRLAVRAEEYQL